MRSNVNLAAGLKRAAALVVVMAFAYGCVPEESAVRDDYGTSVRAMIAEQTYHPSQEAASLDGGKAVKTMDAYRQDVPKPSGETQAPVQINIGTGTQ